MKRQFLRLTTIVVACVVLGQFHGVNSEQLKADAQSVDANEASATTGSAKTTSVVLTIDYGDGMQKRFPQIPWKDGTTVFDALQWADKHPRGIALKSRGKGATRLVQQIDDLKNGGFGKKVDGSVDKRKKNWIYRVNGELADRGCGVFKLKAGDRILWKFDEYQ